LSAGYFKPKIISDAGFLFIMAGLVPAIHVLAAWPNEDVDARHKAGHDG
jgi:hypothetical protein